MCSPQSHCNVFSHYHTFSLSPSLSQGVSRRQHPVIWSLSEHHQVSGHQPHRQRPTLRYLTVHPTSPVGGTPPHQWVAPHLTSGWHPTSPVGGTPPHQWVAPHLTSGWHLTSPVGGTPPHQWVAPHLTSGWHPTSPVGGGNLGLMGGDRLGFLQVGMD